MNAAGAMPSKNAVLTPVNGAYRALAEAKTPEQSKAVEALAAAGKAWAKEQGDYETVVEAERVYILARRKTTELVLPHIRPGQFGREPDNDVRFLSDYNFTHKQWQRRRNELSVPDAVLDNYFDECIEKHTEPTTFGLLGFAGINSVHVSDDSYEWYTPAEYIEAARLVMGGIDLDPASNAQAQKTVKAKQYFTKADDGLSKPWAGRVWLNPPYNMPAIEQFTTRAIQEYDEEKISQAVILTNNATDTNWFHALLEQAGVMCLTKGRVKFWGPDGSAAAGARQGQALFYLGKNGAGFAKAFRPFGAIVEFV